MRARIAITVGDPAGIGGEIAVKALSHASVYVQTQPILVGDTAVLEDALRITGLDLKLHRITDVSQAEGRYGIIDYLDTGVMCPGSWQYGEVSARCGDAAFSYVVTAIRLALDKKVDAVATGPLNKEAMHLAGHMYAGHTEIFAHYTNTARYAMLLTAPGLRVIHVTTHVSLEEACRLIQKQRVLETIRLAAYSAQLLNVQSPRIGVAGLNPHSSENGLFGTRSMTPLYPLLKKHINWA